MKLSEKVISKGTYNYSLPNSPIEVLQYVFIRQRGRKCLLLRFRNNTEFIVNKIEYEIVQLGEKGKEISRTEFKTPPLNETPGSVFTLSDAIIVNEQCVDFRINFIFLKAGKYEYNFSGKDVFVSYESEEYRSTANTIPVMVDNPKNSLIFSSKKPHSFRFATILAIIASMIISAIAIFSYLGENLL